MNWPIFATFLAATAAAAATGNLFRPGPWYDGLRRPDWAPRKWMFPVVWTMLYLLSALAATRVAVLPGNGQAMAFWAMQIAFNTLWSPVFFGLHRMFTALVIILILIVAVGGMVAAFWALDLIAALMVLPYLAWLIVAAALNFWVWRHNRGAGGAAVT